MYRTVARPCNIAAAGTWDPWTSLGHFSIIDRSAAAVVIKYGFRLVHRFLPGTWRIRSLWRLGLNIDWFHRELEPGDAHAVDNLVAVFNSKLSCWSNGSDRTHCRRNTGSIYRIHQMAPFWPHLILGSLGLVESLLKRYLDRFIRFCMTHGRLQRTDTRAQRDDHATPSVAIGHIWSNSNFRKYYLCFSWTENTCTITSYYAVTL